MDDLTAWVLAPIRVGVPPTVDATVFWHAVLMVAGAGGLLPLVLVITRYWKVVPGQDWPRVLDHPLWWRTHRLGGYLAVVLLTIGVIIALGWTAPGGRLTTPHGWIGWLATAMLVALVINGWLRGSVGGPGHHEEGTLGHLHELPGDHYDMTARRLWFERTHKTLGYSLMAVFGLTILTGLWEVNAPRWTLLTIAGWWLLLLGLALRWEREGRAVDGYQARWGPGFNHPGNRIPLLGWGSRRYTEAEFAELRWARGRRGARAAAAAEQAGRPTGPPPV